MPGTFSMHLKEMQPAENGTGSSQLMCTVATRNAIRLLPTRLFDVWMCMRCSARTPGATRGGAIPPTYPQLRFSTVTPSGRPYSPCARAISQFDMSGMPGSHGVSVLR
jgi:hypothetical protein